jgi:putative PIN family toxin of toxin-antitoxin system
MRIVVDTNTVISGIARAAGNPYQILELWRQGTIELLSSTATVTELERVLTYPRVRKLHQLSDEQIKRFVTLYRTQTTHIVVNFALQAVESDPDDNMIIELAVAGNARYIVTGDKKHLLPIGRYRGVEIVSPATFLLVYQGVT